MDEARLATILMADDDEDDRFLTQEAFRECRLRSPLRFAVDGEELMDYLYRRGRFADQATYPTPSLVLLDLNMPRKDGRQALREIRADPTLRSLPVVILTTSNASRDVMDTYRDGCNTFITKPATFEDLKKLVRILDTYWLEAARLPQRPDTVGPQSAG